MLAIAKLALDPMRPMFNDVAMVANVPSRSLLGALSGSVGRNGLNAARMSSANLLF